MRQRVRPFAIKKGRGQMATPLRFSVVQNDYAPKK